MFIGDNHILAKIEASDEEKDEDNNSNRKSIYK